MSTGWKLATGGVLIAVVTAYVAYLGASTSWQYYLTVDECAARAASLAGQRIRVSGMVSAGTLRVAAHGKQADFSLQGTSTRLPVVCAGTVPANLAEDIEVVVEGRLDDSGTLRGDKLLTRCASKYTSKSRPAPSASDSRNLQDFGSLNTATTPPSTGRGDP